MKRTHDRPNCNSFAVLRQLGIVALLTILGSPALADECGVAIGEAYTAARDVYIAGQDAHKEATSDAKAAALVLRTVGEGRRSGASAAAKESADAVHLVVKAVRTARASLKVASNVQTRVAVEKAVNATLNSAIAAENALTVAKENSWQETGPVLRKVSRIVVLAGIAVRAATSVVSLTKQ